MSEWPTSSDLSDALTEAGITPPASGRLASALTLAIEAWEEATGYFPFAAAEGAAASAAPVYWPADASASVIDLGGAVLSSPAPSVALDGTALVAGSDYELRPVAAPRKGQPYTYLYLPSRRLSRHSPEGGLAAHRLVVTGVWGYCAHDAVPELARQAVLAKAALNIAAPATSAGEATGAVKRVEQGTVTIDYGTSTEERLSAVRAWESDWAAGIAKYRRQGVV
jgi:hypothetical protein